MHVSEIPLCKKIFVQTSIISQGFFFFSSFLRISLVGNQNVQCFKEDVRRYSVLRKAFKVNDEY